MNRKLLLRKIWSSRQYYEKILNSEDFSHPGFKRIEEEAKQAANILDVGCGDGTKLEKLGGPRTKKVGVDISRRGIQLAKKRLPAAKFYLCPAEKLPFKKYSFDIVTCLFVLEHTENPEGVIREIARVVRPGGRFYLLAPNFGSPNRASPNFRGSRSAKLISGLINDFFGDDQELNWKRVEPEIESINEFANDLDTTVEPYLGSLIKYLKNLPTKVLEANSYWSEERVGAKMVQKVFGFLGQLELYPFKYWGPHLFVVTRK